MPWKSIHAILVRGSGGNWIRKSWDLGNIRRYQEIYLNLATFIFHQPFFSRLSSSQVFWWDFGGISSRYQCDYSKKTLGREYQTSCWILNIIWDPTIVMSGVMAPVSRVFSRQVPSYNIRPFI